MATVRPYQAPPEATEWNAMLEHSVVPGTRGSVFPAAQYDDGRYHVAWPSLIAGPVEGFNRMWERGDMANVANPDELASSAADSFDVAGGAMTGGLAAGMAGGVPKSALTVNAAQHGLEPEVYQALLRAADERYSFLSSIPDGQQPAAVSGQPFNARMYRGSGRSSLYDKNETSNAPWASSSPREAHTYTEDYLNSGDAQVAPLDVRFSNPLVVDAGGNDWSGIPFNGEFMSTDDVVRRTMRSQPDVDGVLFQNVIENTDGPTTSARAIHRGTIHSPLTGEQLYSGGYGLGQKLRSMMSSAPDDMAGAVPEGAVAANGMKLAANSPTGASVPLAMQALEPRLARAAEQGFTTDAYHGSFGRTSMDGAPQSGSNIDSFAPRYEGDTTWLADSPDVAGTFARKWDAQGPQDGSAIYPTKLNTDDFETLDWGGKEYNFDLEKAVAAAQSRGAKGVAVNNIWEGRAPDQMHTQYAVFDPTKIRSRFAQFDPDQSGSSFLLAANSGAGASVPLAVNAMERNGGLAMDDAARMSRARDMGFDTDTLYHHGTTAHFDEFNPSTSGLYGSGVYVSQDPSVASRFANENTGGHILPLRARGNIAPYEELNTRQKALWDEMDMNEARSAALQQLRDEGYTGVHGPAMFGAENGPSATVIFDPKNLRRTDAAFDPSRSDSANLLAANHPLGSSVPLAFNDYEDEQPQNAMMRRGGF